jgi:hypothetical protein
MVLEKIVLIGLEWCQHGVSDSVSDGDDGVRVSLSKGSKQFEATGHDDDSDVDDVIDNIASDCAR